MTIRHSGLLFGPPCIYVRLNLPRHL